MSCKGTSQGEENKKENWSMTNEVVQVESDSLAEEAFRQVVELLK